MYDKLRIINTGKFIDIGSLLHLIPEYLLGCDSEYERDVNGATEIRPREGPD